MDDVLGVSLETQPDSEAGLRELVDKVVMAAGQVGPAGGQSTGGQLLLCERPSRNKESDVWPLPEDGDPVLKEGLLQLSAQFHSVMIEQSESSHY